MQTKHPQDYLSRQSRLGLVWITVLCITVALVGVFWRLRPEVPDGVWDASIVAYLLGGGATLLNIAATLAPGTPKVHRLVHLWLVVAFVLACGFFWCGTGRHVKVRDKWFLREGHRRLDKFVEAVRRNDSLLADTPHDLGTPLRFPVPAYGKTNADGSLTIWFGNRDNEARLGYIYHSGNPLAADPFHADSPHFRHLTNGWYED